MTSKRTKFNVGDKVVVKRTGKKDSIVNISYDFCAQHALYYLKSSRKDTSRAPVSASGFWSYELKRASK